MNCRIRRHVRSVAAAVMTVAISSWAHVSAAQEKISWYGVLVTPQEATGLASQLPPSSVVGPEWGTAAASRLTIGPCDASIRSSVSYQAINCDKIESLETHPFASVGFPVHLPTGALITAARLNYYDTHPSEEGGVSLVRVTQTGALDPIAIVVGPSAFFGGNNQVTVTLNTPHEVVNAGATYQLLSTLFRVGSTYTAIYNVEIFYRLQVSPAPATATFNDVPVGSPYHRFVEALAASGITGGCGSGLYCPDDPVTRGQIAVFLAVALGLHFPN